MPDAALPGHKSSYMQSRLMRRYPLAQNLAAHESPPSPRATRARRPGSSNITASCVGNGGCAVTRSAPPFPRRPRNRPLRCRPRASLPSILPARPSLAPVQQTRIKPCSIKERRRAGEKIMGRIKGCRRSVTRPTPGQTGSRRKCEHAFAGVASFARRWFVRSSPRAMAWPKPPPSAVKVLLAALRSTYDSGGVSANALLGFGFGQNQADGAASF